VFGKSFLRKALLYHLSGYAEKVGKLSPTIVIPSIINEAGASQVEKKRKGKGAANILITGGERSFLDEEED